MIKKLGGFMLLLGGICLAAPTMGQKKVYFEETFTNGRLGDMWNEEESSYIDAAGGPVYPVGVSATTVIAGWVYDPDGNVITTQTGLGVATTMLDGQYLLVTNPFQMVRVHGIDHGERGCAEFRLDGEGHGGRCLGYGLHAVRSR